MKYPTLEEVNVASPLQICRWWRFLHEPSTREEVEVINLITELYFKNGGITPEISKKIG